MCSGVHSLPLGVILLLVEIILGLGFANRKTTLSLECKKPACLLVIAFNKSHAMRACIFQNLESEEVMGLGPAPHLKTVALLLLWVVGCLAWSWHASLQLLGGRKTPVHSLCGEAGQQDGVWCRSMTPLL